MQLIKGDKIVFSPSESGFMGYNGLISRSIVNVLKDGRPCVSISGFNQPILLHSIKRVLPKSEWREF